jgi:serine protease DegS
MDLKKLTPYVMQGLAVGLVAGFLFMFFWNPEVPDVRPIVEFKEAETVEPAGRSSLSVAGPVSYAEAVENAAPSVVNIFTTKVTTRQTHPLFDDPVFRRFFGESPLGPQERRESSLGSGVIVSKQGFVLTNNHVIAEADEILVALRDGRSIPASVVGTDPETDLAVLYIEADELPAITLGHSDNMNIGDVVLAIGNPFGVGQTVTMGIVSATGRSQLGISTYENFIQTDAAINPGNSGGALVDAHGNLVGINTAIFSRTGGSQGIGFAIPINLAKTVLQQVIEYGHTIRGWLGVEVQDISRELAESFDLASQNGVLIAGVLKDGPADTANIQPGDVITKVNGENIRDANQLINMVAGIKPDTEITVEGLRAGKSFSVTAHVGERPVSAQRTPLE